SYRWSEESRQVTATKRTSVGLFPRCAQARGCRLDRAGSYIQRTDYTSPAAIEDMRVDHRGLHVRMPEQFLNRTDVVPRFEQMRGEGMSQRVHAARLDDARISYRLFDRALQCVLRRMMSALDTRARVERPTRGRKQVLPAPFEVCIRVLVLERVREIDAAEACSDVVFMQLPHLRKVGAQRLDQRMRQNRHAILLTLRVADDELPVLEVHVLNAQA